MRHTLRVLGDDVKYDILGLYNDSRMKCGYQPDDPLATDIGLPETPEYRATYGKHDVQRMYRLRGAMKLTVFQSAKMPNTKGEQRLAVT